jgi:pyrroline-5-carboxylate reductase
MFDLGKITFLGPGVMAEAMISALIRQKMVDPKQILASGPRVERGLELEQRYGITSIMDNGQAVQNADVVVLAIKPQRLESVLNDCHEMIKTGTLVLSIIAGVPIKNIINGLAHDIVIRAMPNTPAQIGEGISVWAASPDVNEDHLKKARMILTAFGDEIFVEDENYLDMATALSGTGPAYVYLFMEAMVDAGVHLGFPRRIAEKLVAHTVRGSVDYYDLRDEPVHLARLRNEVTSPAGTSAAALYYLEKAGFRTAISRAIWAAYVRSQELGKGLKTHPPEENSVQTEDTK